MKQIDDAVDHMNANRRSFLKAIADDDCESKATLEKISNAPAGPEFDKAYIQAQYDNHVELRDLASKWMPGCLPNGAAGAAFSLLGEDLGHVSEGFELEGVAGGVVEEHGGLLADLALKADVGFDLEVLASGAETVG